jgi:hypothetical protein
MPSPFPGMDPYLERRNVWSDVHSALIVATRDALAPQVAPVYYVAIEERMYIVASDSTEFIGRPDVAIIAAPIEARPAGQAETTAAVVSVAQTVVLPQFEEVHERYLEIRDAQTHVVVTAIEILSPSNKAPGEGREAYEEKRRQVLSTRANLVEIDLLRGGRPMEMQPPPQGDYRILVRAGNVPRHDCTRAAYARHFQKCQYLYVGESQRRGYLSVNFSPIFTPGRTTTSD